MLDDDGYAIITRETRCTDSDCGLCGLSYSDLQYQAHKHLGALRMTLNTAQRRGDFIKLMELWPAFTTWVRTYSRTGAP